MHIVLGLLGGIVTILILLKRLDDSGIDIGWLNPFAWNRRRTWRNKYEGNPIYSVDKPMELTALLMVAAVKSEGEISSDQKTKILDLFKNEFHLNRSDANALLGSSVFLLGDGEELHKNINKLVRGVVDKFTSHQAESTMKLVDEISSLEGDKNDLQQSLLDVLKTVFEEKFGGNNKWV